MARPKKDARVLNIKLATPVHDKLDQFCGELGITKTVAAEKIFAQFLDQYFERPEEERLIFGRRKDGVGDE